MKQISDYMSQDHKSCDELLVNCENLIDEDNWQALELGFNEFKKSMQHHFSLEEEILFPAFESKTGMTEGPTAMMRHEHDQMRVVIAKLEETVPAKDSDSFLATSQTLNILIQQHNMKEEQMLYAMCDAHLASNAEELVLKMKNS